MAAFAHETRPLRRVEFDKLVELGAFRGERLELLDGALVLMSPVGPPHSSSVQELTEMLVVALLGRAKVRVQLPFAARDLSEPQPDIAVVPLGAYDTAHPDKAFLLIEVAESSLDQDRKLKARIYAECEVPEYWIVNLVDRRVEVHKEPRHGAYEHVVNYPSGATITIGAFPDIAVRVDDLMKPAR